MGVRAGRYASQPLLKQGRTPRGSSLFILRYNSSLCVASALASTPFASVRIYRGLPARADAPIALTIGNFDGVHRGHQAMLTRLLEAAEDLRLPSAVLTFDPHPREYLSLIHI